MNNLTRQYHLYQIDAFTKEIFTGNPASVITNADGLSDSEMQQIARELNNSETAFIFQSADPEYDVNIRFFTPAHEVPICGHATIAAHYARAIENNLDSMRVYQKTGVGILPIDIVKEDNDYKIAMTQSIISFGDTIEGELLDTLLRALGISNSDLIDECPVQIASTGYSKVMIGIRGIELLHKLNPDMEMLKSISKEINCNGYCIFAMNPQDPDILIHDRVFAPISGVNEDPVTGNANGPLGAFLVHHRLVKHDNHLLMFKAVQGEAINRAGTIHVVVDINNNEPVQVRISGYARIVFKSVLSLSKEHIY